MYDDDDGNDGINYDPESPGGAPDWVLRQDPANYMECGCYEGGPCPHRESADDYARRTARERVDALLADRTPWTLVDVMRELGMSEQFAAQYAFRSMVEQPSTQRAYPAPLPGTPVFHLIALRRMAKTGNADDGPRWAAGDIRLWGMRTARLDHNCDRITRRPVPLRRRGTPGWSQ